MPARAGDLVIVVLAGVTALGVLLGTSGGQIALRFWVRSRWSGPGHVAQWQVLRLAPEDEQTAAARAALAAEQAQPG